MGSSCDGGGGGGGEVSCCRSPKSPGLFLVTGIKSKQMLVSLLAIVCGLLLLLKNPSLLESERWRPVIFQQDHHLDLGSALKNDRAVPIAASHSSHSTNFGISPSIDDDTTNTNGSGDRCDFSRGRWVFDETKPRYTGHHCRAWLSKPWMCRLDRHHNLSYESYRWQPRGCDLPGFDSTQLLHRLRNKTIAFVGDSLGRQQYQSMICMLVGDASMPKITDVSIEYGLVAKGEGAQRFAATNTTVLFHWSASLGDPQPLEAGLWALHLDRAPGFLARNAQRLDVVIVNTGHHWNRGKIRANNWVLHVNGKVANLRVDAARRIALTSAARWLGVQRERIRGFVRSLSPRHFRGGDWNSGGRCDGIREIEEEEELGGDLIAQEAVRSTNGAVTLLEISNLSRTRGEAHISSAFVGSSSSSSSSSPRQQDCLHWCLPGVPDTWNELLFAHLIDDRAS
ncbi:protein trichome birefringence-like 14 [Selaginella moellendorffii]|nr:protein trichome birefringence-like 14 [Selaginella moellendorffii]|eukprot:XP_002975623.2 protein trichome birefringence-like 14 [Selaginella moellendorffii]